LMAGCASVGNWERKIWAAAWDDVGE
jgi:hypothetical protein